MHSCIGYQAAQNKSWQERSDYRTMVFAIICSFEKEVIAERWKETDDMNDNTGDTEDNDNMLKLASAQSYCDPFFI